jgi:hypothetical protein
MAAGAACAKAVCASADTALGFDPEGLVPARPVFGSARPIELSTSVRTDQPWYEQVRLSRRRFGLNSSTMCLTHSIVLSISLRSLPLRRGIGCKSNIAFHFVRPRLEGGVCVYCTKLGVATRRCMIHAGPTKA